jgi:hypothetical protein
MVLSECNWARYLMESLCTINENRQNAWVFRRICGYRAIAARDRNGYGKGEWRAILAGNGRDYSVTRSFGRADIA